MHKSYWNKASCWQNWQGGGHFCQFFVDILPGWMTNWDLSSSSSLLLLQRFTTTQRCWPPTSSSLKITNRSFHYASPHLWNQLPVSFRQPCTKHPADDVTFSNSPNTCSPLSPSITHSLFHSRLKTHLSTNLFHHSLLAPTWTAFSDYTGPDLLCSTVFHF